MHDHDSWHASVRIRFGPFNLYFLVVTVRGVPDVARQRDDIGNNGLIRMERSKRTPTDDCDPNLSSDAP